MALQGKQMRVGAREGFAYYSVKLVLLAKGNRYEVDSNTFFQSGKTLYPFWVLPCHNSDHFLKYLFVSVLCSLCLQQEKEKIELGKRKQAVWQDVPSFGQSSQRGRKLPALQESQNQGSVEQEETELPTDPASDIP